LLGALASPYHASGRTRAQPTSDISASRRADKAKKRLSEIDRDIEKYLDFVDLDNERFAKESGAVRTQISREDLEKLMRLSSRRS
jgi:hypothetical protein